MHRKGCGQGTVLELLDHLGRGQGLPLGAPRPNADGVAHQALHGSVILAGNGRLQLLNEGIQFGAGFRLGNGRFGVLVADVADKGTGAALYMALSRTLIRTYAMQCPDAPEEALRLANERILADTESDQFVTVFYAVLDTANGTMTYANGGHNPAFLLAGNGRDPQSLSKTGIPLGMFEGMAWQQQTVAVAPGDRLVLYSDGVTEAQDAEGNEFGEKRLLAALQGESAEGMVTAVLTAIHDFVGDAPQFDDVTLVIAAKQK